MSSTWTTAGQPQSSALKSGIYTFWRKYKKHLPVNVTAEMRYSRPGVKDGVLVCDSGAVSRSASFKKVGGTRTAVQWPQEKGRKQ